MQIVIGSQGREALPVFEMLPVHNSLDRILGFKKLYQPLCQTGQSQALIAWNFPKQNPKFDFVY